MYTKGKYNELLQNIVTAIDITEEMFDDAEKTYTDLGNWINDRTPAYDISIYPQGSFALGTVIRPISNADDYDMDVVVQFERSYGLTAKELKVDTVKPLLVSYKKSSRDIENKRRCWHVEYEDIPHFHMDVIPSYLHADHIEITDHNEDNDSYDYIGSNPHGYIQWFYGQCAQQREVIYERDKLNYRTVVTQADLEKLKRKRIKTPLQRAVQILKRHRDIVFQNDDSGKKPISIIITTIAAQLYKNEDNIYDAITNILLNAPQWIIDQKVGDQFRIVNPVFPEENFADKWNDHPERATAFFEWMQKAYADLSDMKLLDMDLVHMGNHIRNTFGSATCDSVFTQKGENTKQEILNGQLKVDPKIGALSAAGTIRVLENHHYAE